MTLSRNFLMNKGQKLVRILELLTRQGGVRADVIVDRFGLDARTLRRYMSDLRDLDIPLHDEGRGEERTLSVDPKYRRTGVHLTLLEVLSLHFGRKLFNFLDGTSFADDHDDALLRLAPAISRGDQDLVRQLDTKFLAVPEPSKDYSGNASEVLDDVITALLYNNPIDARYRKANGSEKRYLLNPYTLGTFRQGLYLFAYDTEAGLVKTFAIERFVDLTRRRKARFEMPTGWRPDAHIAHAFGIIGGPPTPVIVAFRTNVAAYIRERSWHPTQTYRTLADGRLELRMEVAITVEVVTWILGFGPDAEVFQPLELRERVAATLQRAAQQYGGSG